MDPKLEKREAFTFTKPIPRIFKGKESHSLGFAKEVQKGPFTLLASLGMTNIVAGLLAEGTRTSFLVTGK